MFLIWIFCSIIKSLTSLWTLMSVCWLVGWSVCWLVCHNFLNGQWSNTSLAPIGAFVSGCVYKQHCLLVHPFVYPLHRILLLFVTVCLLMLCWCVLCVQNASVCLCHCLRVDVAMFCLMIQNACVCMCHCLRVDVAMSCLMCATCSCSFNNLFLCLICDGNIAYNYSLFFYCA